MNGKRCDLVERERELEGVSTRCPLDLNPGSLSPLGSLIFMVFEQIDQDCRCRTHKKQEISTRGSYLT